VLRSVLVALDLSPISARVAARAALLPLVDGARLTLLHVVPRLLPPAFRRQAEQSAHKALEAAAEEIAPSLAAGVELQTVVTAGFPAKDISSHAGAVQADLVVVGRGGARALRDTFIGSTAERVIRQSRVAVLAVRNAARARYRRPLLALDLDDAAPEALRLVLRLFPPPRPELALVHVYDGSTDQLDTWSATDEQAAECRRLSREAAVRRIAHLLAISHRLARGEDVRWSPRVRIGSPRHLIPKIVAKHRADLLVVGTRGRSGVAQAFLGTIAGDLLRAVSCDVLVVPPRRAPKA
jgi:nucleotide-binding universal stress UspA family protein